MSRIPEIPKEPNWHALALKEVEKLPDLQPEESLRISGKIAEVIEKMKIMGAEHRSVIDRRVLYYGSKRMSLFVDFTNPHLATAETHVESFLQTEKAVKETTILYIAAKIILQSIADNTGKSIIYEFVSGFPKMQQWAKSTGEIIFGWREPPYEVTFNPHIS